MPHDIDFVDDSTQLAHYEMLKTIRDFAVANGWTELRYDIGGTDHEVILQAPGLTATEEIFVGFRTYHDVGGDYYNMDCGVFTGYVPGSEFDEQPGAQVLAVPCHNQRIDYWLTLNAQRIALGMKVGTPVYEHCYVGKFFPYATRNQYPYPVCCAGTLSASAATRFSDTSHKMPWNDNATKLKCRFVDGSWKETTGWPFSVNLAIRDSGGTYPVLPLILETDVGLLGEMDGISYVCGFDNVVENTMVIDGDTWVVLQSVYRTGFNDYIAMRMDT